MCELNKLSHLKFDASVAAETVKISTRQLQMRWLLKEMGDGTLIGLLHVTPKTHLRVIKLLQTNLF